MRIDEAEVPKPVLPAAIKIREWLIMEKPDTVWQSHDDPNRFFSNKMEALYVYSNKVIYWEGIRSPKQEVFTVPKNREELSAMITYDSRRRKKEQEIQKQFSIKR